MNRKEVYKILDGERDYQDSIGGKMEHRGKPTIEAEILMMEEYLLKAREKWVNTYGDSEPALDMLRKVVGIALRCFENHGCTPRLMEKIKTSAIKVRNVIRMPEGIQLMHLNYGSNFCAQ